MPIILANNKAILHIPKTGGMWIRKTLKDNKIPFEAYAPDINRGGFERCLLKPSEAHHLAITPEGIEKKNISVIVRDPVGWYTSFYLFRCHSEKWTWSYRRPFDKAIQGHTLGSFPEFIDRVKELYPEGFLNRLYSKYTRKAGNIINLIDIKYGLNKIFDDHLYFGFPTNTRKKELKVELDVIKDIISYEKETFKFLKAAK